MTYMCYLRWEAEMKCIHILQLYIINFVNLLYPLKYSVLAQ